MQRNRLPLFLMVALSLVQVASGANATDFAEGRIDRNFRTTEVRGPVIPAIPASAIQVSRGTVTVRIDKRKYKLEAYTVTPPGAGPFPLAVVSHGMPLRGGSKPRRNMRIRILLPIAEDFARRGYKAVVFARRGFASSKGRFQEGYGKCRDASKAGYVRVARNGAKDYAAIIEAFAAEPDVDGSTVVVAGHSGGGLVASRLASQPPPGLVGIINFAGGRGGAKKGGNCSESGFVGAFREFGRGAGVPALWLYSTTDTLFWPELVDRALDAYAGDGAPVRLERIGPLWFTDNGHVLHHLGAREYWRPRIDAFLNAIGAPNWEVAPDDAAVDKLPPPSSLGNNGRKRWRRYLAAAGHKAFAIGPGGRFGWAALRDTTEDAVESAMKFCTKEGHSCRTISIDGEMVP